MLLCMLIGPDTSWLNAINILLGAVATLCVLLVVVVVCRELVSRRQSRDTHLSRRLRSISLRQLGFGPTETKSPPDEKDLHPGKIPERKSESRIYTV